MVFQDFHKVNFWTGLFFVLFCSTTHFPSSSEQQMQVETVAIGKNQRLLDNGEEFIQDQERMKLAEEKLQVFGQSQR